jgi:hypothetical protein
MKSPSLRLIIVSAFIIVVFIAPLSLAQQPRTRPPEPAHIPVNLIPDVPTRSEITTQGLMPLPEADALYVRDETPYVEPPHRRIHYNNNFSRDDSAASRSAPRATFTVNYFGDMMTADAAPGDGICADIFGDCALRTAVIEANADATTNDLILIPPATITLSIEGIDEDAAQTGDLDIYTPMMIYGAGASQTLINANGIDRVFDIYGNILVDLYDLGITGGDVTLSTVETRGGGIRISCRGNLLLKRSNVFTNKAIIGGGIYVINEVVSCPGDTSYLYLYESAVYSNEATSAVGGVEARNASTVNMRNATISMNSAVNDAGIRFEYGAIGSINFSTITDNVSSTSGAGFNVYDVASSVSLSNSVIAYNRYGAAFTNLDCNMNFGGTYTSGGDNGYKVADDCVVAAADTTTNVILGFPQFLTPGQTLSVSPDVGSSLIDLDSDLPIFENDQRGVSRPYGAGAESGSVELATGVTPPATFSLLTPANGTTLSNAPTQFTWQESAGATHYTFSMYNSVENLFNSLWMSAAADSDGLTCASSVCTFTLSTQQVWELTTLDTYTWTVTAGNAAISAATVGPFAFTYAAPTATPTSENTATATPTSDGATSTPDATTTSTTTPDATATATPNGTEGVQLLSNTSFDELGADSKPVLTPWTLKNGTADKIKCNKPGKTFGRTGNCAFVFKGGVGEKSKLRQIPDVVVIASPGDNLTVALYTESRGGTTNAKVKLLVKYTDGTDKTKLTLTVLSNASYAILTGNEQLDSLAVGSMRVSIDNKAISGKLLVDDVTLTLSSATLSVMPLPR